MENISRRDFMKTAGLATLIGVTGCATTPKSEDYAFNEFKDALGDQYNVLSYEDKRKTRKLWNETPTEDKQLLLDFYNNPIKTYNFVFDTADGEENIENFLQIIPEEARTNQGFQKEISYFPWMNHNNLSKSDSIFLGFIDEVKVLTFKTTY